MNSNTTVLIRTIAGAAMAIALAAGAQTPAPPPEPASMPAAQTPAPAAPAAPADAAPTPLSTFVLTGPLTWLPPAMVDVGPFGKVAVNGIVTAYGQAQNNPLPTDGTARGNISNGLIFVQKPTGTLQYFVQAGAYELPALGVPYASASATTNAFYGAVPVWFLKLQAGKTTQLEAGNLPTLMGAESTFTYQNFNIERGLLWNQENAINRGFQVNQTLGKYFSAAFSWNDGYYSTRFNWLSGSMTFTKGPHTLVYDGMGNAGKTGFSTAATPLLQNNSSMHTVIYTYSKGPWIASATYQYSNVPTNAKIFIPKGATANGFGAYLSYAAKCGFSLPGRFEYITQSGSVGGPDASLLYGPGSSAVSFTATPTYQKGGFFFRADVSELHAMNFTNGSVFGPLGKNGDQFRAVGELGFIFGDNIVKK